MLGAASDVVGRIKDARELMSDELGNAKSELIEEELWLPMDDMRANVELLGTAILGTDSRS